MEGREERLKLAIEAIESGAMSKKKAAVRYGVARSTIQFRMGNKFKKPGYGPSTYLTKEEEDQLVKYVKSNFIRLGI